MAGDEAIDLKAGVLAGCLDGYRLFTGSLRDFDDGGENQAVSYDEDNHDDASRNRDLNSPDFQVLLWRLKIEEARLEMWGRVSRSSSTARKPDESAGSDKFYEDDYKEFGTYGDDGTSLKTLLQISDLLKDYEELQQRYGLELVAHRMELLGMSNPSVKQQLIEREFKRYHSGDIQAVKKTGRKEKFLKKFRWVVKDGMKVKEAISGLGQYNDTLCRLLSPAERDSVRQGITAAVVTTENLASLSRLQLAGSQYRNLSEIVLLRTHKLEIDNTVSIDVDSSATLSGDMKIDSAKITPLSNSSSKAARGNNRYIGSYADASGTSPQRVLVEWKYFTANDESGGRQQVELSRLTNLAQVLHEPTKPAGLCVPRCLGYISDEWNSRVHSRVGYVFQWNQGSAEVRSLHDLLGVERVPHLGERFNLAVRLSRAVSVLHLAGWLHRAIRSHNIAFSCAEGKSERDAPRLDNAQLLGFDYSHPGEHVGLRSGSGNSIAKTTSPEHDFNLYRHTEVQGPAGEGFSASSDIYALGVVLLEIGYWRRISDLWQTGHTMETFQRDLLKAHVPRLGAKVGKIYMDVTALCLSRECGAGRGTAEPQQQFYWDVVRRLSLLVV